ncbi:hypothetical protein [Burkholderia sp. YIM B11467]
MTASGTAMTDVDIPFRAESKPCDFKGEGTEQRSDVDNRSAKSLETLCIQAVSVSTLKPAKPHRAGRWRLANAPNCGAHRTTQVC